MNSNVVFKSNVYPVQEKRVTKDKDFLKRVQGQKALKKIVNYIYGPAIHYDTYKEKLRRLGIKKWQLETWELDIYCSKHPEKSIPFGLIQKNGDYIVECRCDHFTCPYYNNCIT